METLPKGAADLAGIIRTSVDREAFAEQHWEGSFQDYHKVVEGNPLVLCNAFQRLYDMIHFHGVEEAEEGKERVVRFKFFEDPIGGGEDALFGLEKPLQNLVNILKAAAFGYGPERRVLLLHGPVGSSKSTIVRLLKKGIEDYSRRPDGALYTFGWRTEPEEDYVDCPMHEEPLKLVPEAGRKKILDALNRKAKKAYRLDVEGELCPSCRFHLDERMKR